MSIQKFVFGWSLLMSGGLIGQDTAFICHQDLVEIVSLDNLNSKSIEFSPTYYQNGIVFVIAREKNRFIDPRTGRAYFDLMYTDIGSDGTIGKVVSFSPNIRTQYHEGPCCFNQDATELFFTRSNLSGGVGINDEKRQVQLKIYRGIKGSEDWERIEALPFSSDYYSVAHPTLSADGMYMVFTSNMPGGRGGMDLYVVNRLNGNWSTPVNLGPGINSKGNEVFPFWHENGVLIFSSDGLGGQGGLDLYATHWNDQDQFVGLQRLAAPFNSKRDDLSLIISPDGQSGYFASDRKPTKGKDDLYRWTSPQSIFCMPEIPIMHTHDLLVVDESKQGVDQVSVWLIAMSPQGPALHQELFTTELVPNPEKEGAFYLKWSTLDTLSKATANAVTNHAGKASIASDGRSTYVLVAQRDGYSAYVDVYPYDLLPDTITLRKKSTLPLPCLKTRFFVYNETGSKTLNGAGLSFGAECLNVPGKVYTNEDGEASYCLPPKCMIRIVVEQEGYATQAFSLMPIAEDTTWSIYLKSSEGLTSPPAPIASGTVIVLDHIYYDFNKSEIRKGEAGELIALAAILKKYPDLKIELTSHTDTRGTADYNMELSQRRSESCKSFLVLQGIRADRITTLGAGESQPRNRCADEVPCTETEHQHNRRTEVKIINPAEGMVVKYKSEG